MCLSKLTLLLSLLLHWSHSMLFYTCYHIQFSSYMPSKSCWPANCLFTFWTSELFLFLGSDRLTMLLDLMLFKQLKSICFEITCITLVIILSFMNILCVVYSPSYAWNILYVLHNTSLGHVLPPCVNQNQTSFSMFYHMLHTDVVCKSCFSFSLQEENQNFQK